MVLLHGFSTAQRTGTAPAYVGAAHADSSWVDKLHGAEPKLALSGGPNKTRQDKRLILSQPAWLIRRLIHHLDQSPASFPHQLQEAEVMPCW